MMKVTLFFFLAAVAMASAGLLGEGPEVYSSVTTKQVHSPFATSSSTRSQHFNDLTYVAQVAAPVATYAAAAPVVAAAPVATYAAAAPVTTYAAAAPVATYTAAAPVATYAAAAPVATYAAAAPVASYYSAPIAYSSNYGYSGYSKVW